MDDLFVGFDFTWSDKLGELRREIGMRQRVYARQVALGRMTQDAADRGVAIMRAIAADYENKGSS
jgi:hypothetical protein